MRLQQYLISESSESGRTKTITKEEFIDLARKHCRTSVKNYLDKKCTIYRGDHNSDSFIYGDASKSLTPRKSKNTSNHYTLWMDNHPLWSKFPKRSRSFICASGEYAGNFAEYRHIILPYDGVKIGVCPDNDLWDTGNICDNTNGDLSDLLGCIYSIAENASRNFTHSDKDYKTLMSCIEQFDKFDIKKHVTWGDYDSLYDYIKKVGDVSSYNYFMSPSIWEGTLLETLEHFWSPTVNNIKLCTSSDTINSNTECWMEGPVLMVLYEDDINNTLEDV